MRIKKVNRYWCDHCNKAGLQSRSMAIHEKHCTMNPARECRVCHLLEGSDGDTEDKRPLAELIKMLPDATAYNGAIGLANSLGMTGYELLNSAQRQLSEALAACFPAFRRAAGDCPACIMAALRLAKIPVPMAEDFDFKKMMERALKHYNDGKNEGGYY